MASTYLKRFLILSVVLLMTKFAFGAPSNTISIPNTFSPGTVILSNQTNANNNEIQGKYNAHSHTDIAQLGVVTSGSWAGTAISPQYGGTGQDLSSVASGSMIYFDGTGTMSTFTHGSSGQILQTGVGGAAPFWVTNGKIAQTVYSQSHTTATGVTAIPGDDTKPQITEGDEYMTCTITPVSVSDYLKIDVIFNGTSSTIGAAFVVALFQDAVPNALAVANVTLPAANYVQNLKITYITPAYGATSTVFRVRAGDNIGATTTFNGSAGASVYGNTLMSSITISEIVP